MSFAKRFKPEIATTSLQAIPLSKDINDAHNELLTTEVTDDEIVEVVKQINPMKALGPGGMQAYSIRRAKILLVSMSVRW